MDNSDEATLSRKERRELEREKEKQQEGKKEASSKIKKLLTWGVVILVLGFLAFRGYKFITASVPDVVRVPIEVVASDRVKGPESASVILIEYSDFQCPACAAYYPLVKKLSEEFPQDIRIVYRHFPLTQTHKNALSSAKASEAAGAQGKFWEMHDMLFEKQGEWSELGSAKDKFVEYANELGLDKQKFLSDFDSREVSEKINAEMTSGNTLGITGTPTFFLNGAKVAPGSYEKFKGMVEAEKNNTGQQ